jgi:hypothetical protein
MITTAGGFVGLDQLDCEVSAAVIARRASSVTWVFKAGSVAVVIFHPGTGVVWTDPIGWSLGRLCDFDGRPPSAANRPPSLGHSVEFIS